MTQPETDTSLINQLRNHTAEFDVQCELPAMTKKAQATTAEINNDRGTQGSFTHELLPQSLIKAMNKWANAARYLRVRHGVRIGDRYMIPLTATDAIADDIAAVEANRDQIIDHAKANWHHVVNFVNSTLANLEDSDMRIYASQNGFDTWKSGFKFVARILPLPPSGIEAIPTTFVGQQRADAAAMYAQQEQEFIAGMTNAIRVDLESLLSRYEARATWFAGGAVESDEPKPKISVKFVEGINDRIAAVGTVSAGLIPEVTDVCTKWAAIGPAISGNLDSSLVEAQGANLIAAVSKLIQSLHGQP